MSFSQMSFSQASFSQFFGQRDQKPTQDPRDPRDPRDPWSPGNFGKDGGFRPWKPSASSNNPQQYSGRSFQPVDPQHPSPSRSASLSIFPSHTATKTPSSPPFQVGSAPTPAPIFYPAPPGPGDEEGVHSPPPNGGRGNRPRAMPQLQAKGTLTDEQYSMAYALFEAVKEKKTDRFQELPQKTLDTILSAPCWNIWCNKAFEKIYKKLQTSEKHSKFAQIIKIENLKIPEDLNERWEGKSALGFFLLRCLHEFYENTEEGMKRFVYTQLGIDAIGSALGQTTTLALAKKVRPLPRQTPLGSLRGRIVLWHLDANWLVGKIVRAALIRDSEGVTQERFAVDFGSDLGMRQVSKKDLLFVEDENSRELSQSVRLSSKYAKNKERAWLNEIIQKSATKQKINERIAKRLSLTRNSKLLWNALWNDRYGEYGLKIPEEAPAVLGLYCFRLAYAITDTLSSDERLQSLIDYNRSPLKGWRPKVGDPAPLWLFKQAYSNYFADECLREGEWVLFKHPNSGILSLGEVVNHSNRTKEVYVNVTEASSEDPYFASTFMRSSVTSEQKVAICFDLGGLYLIDPSLIH